MKQDQQDGKELLEALISKQKEKQLTDAQFAKLLGISSVTWRHTRTGILAIPRHQIYAGIFNNFPDLKKLLNQYQRSIKEE